MTTPTPQTTKVIRVIGFDPGFNITGWGIIDYQQQQVAPVACGYIKTDPKQATSFRLAAIYKQLIEVVSTYTPEEAAIEKIFVNKNPQASITLGMARGVVALVPAMAGLALHHYQATTIKKLVAGNGHASKEQIQHMLRHTLPTIEVNQPDSADALAIALCHIYHQQSSFTH